MASEVFGVGRADASSSGVSWSAVLGGAFVMAAVSLLLLALGAGFELSTIALWSGVGPLAARIGTIALIWIIVTQVIASSFGGYLTGRLRSRWHAIHNDEVHFRDTANGLVAWAVAVVVSAAFLGTAASVMAGRAATERGGVSAEQGNTVVANAYFVDRLFRSERPSSEADGAARAEASRIIAHDLRNNEAASADEAYLSQMVAAKTGLSAADASKRVSDVMADARQSAEELRRTSARILMWSFFALIIGAFCASFAATIGGRQRDHVQVI